MRQELIHILIVINFSNILALVPALTKIYQRKAMSINNLSKDDILELVLEYLSTSGFSEAEVALKKEMGRSTSSKKQLASGSRLEDLLEKSYVTELASGEFFPMLKKAKRTHLDAILQPREEDGSVRLKMFITSIIV